MNDGNLVILAIAVALGLVAARRKDGSARQGLSMATVRFLETLPRVALALLAAGFIGKLIPSEAVGHLIGPESGFMGILIATVVGAFVPSGPIVSFPVVVVFTQAGAGFPQCCAFITAWSILAFHRALIYEITLMGWHFTITRTLSSLILPIVCGLLAQFLAWIHPIKWPPW